MRKLPPRHLFLLVTLLAAAIAVCAPFLQPQKIKATWLWETSLIMKEKNDIIAFARENDVNLIYLQIDKKLPPDQYRAFIRDATREGIQIHASGGEPEWAFHARRENITQLVEWVKNYNRTSKQEERFRGIHVDIEPYLLPEWDERKKRIVRQWMNNMEVFIEATKQEPSLETSAALPFWLDDVSIPKQTGANRLSEWMIRQLDHVTLMAYRDFTEGANGILHIVENEINDADKLGKAVVIGVETKNMGKAEQISFHDDGMMAMGEQLALLQKHLRKHPSFAGIAIHDYVSWKEASR
jgi:hypothetical protein